MDALAKKIERFNRICYFYHLSLSFLSILIGVVSFFLMGFSTDGTIAIKIIIGIAFCLLSIATFLIGPISFLAGGLIFRFSAILWLLSGDDTIFSNILFAFGVLNIFTIYPAIKGRREDETSIFIF